MEHLAMPDVVKTNTESQMWTLGSGSWQQQQLRLPRLVLARRLGRDEHRVAVAARGAGAEQLGGASSLAGQSSSVAIVLLIVLSCA
jgi:hypothetical protein